MKRFFVVSLSMVALSTNAIAQSDSSKTKEPLPLVVSVGTHTLSFPWYNKPLTYRFNPGLVIGTEFTHKKWKHFRFSQPVNLGFFQHEYIESGLFVNTDLGFSYVTGFGLHADFLLGAGYLHTFSRRKLFELKNGEYVEATDWGRPAFMFSLAGALGYQFKSNRRLSFSPFIQYRWFAQTPFADEIPVITHLLLSVGTKIYFGGI
ncbi:MAG: hypothetical protein ACRENG_22605 [bacterium]